MIIQVLGSGCPTCKKLFETVKKVQSELKIDAELDYITDVAKMIEMGVMTSPVLAIDGKPVLTGGGHSEEEIKNALVKNLPQKPKNTGGCLCGGDC
ncbi:TM0996/MTH895 family glutaredoxin-like protein [Patescibacteria group bacterium]|nr:TM0996/MTH895 family glutaredoxin-like protein [Patescibacteria group bacterium]